MRLALDVGNSQIKVGLFQGNRLRARWWIETDPHQTPDAYGTALARFLGKNKVAGAILASVVPALTPVLREALRQRFSLDARVVTHHLKTGLRILHPHPEEIGADRLVNAAEAYGCFGGPVAVVDFGTATTFTVVSGDGDYLGGAIAPGLGTAASALATRTARLPHVFFDTPGRSAQRSAQWGRPLASVEPGAPEGVPNRAISVDTVSALRSGLFFGQVGLVEEMLRRIHDEVGGLTYALATGGFANDIAPLCKAITDIIPDLTLAGLNRIYQMNPVSAP